MRLFAITLSVAMAASVASAGQGWCDHCGCPQQCKTTCRLVCEPKQEKHVVYSCTLEEFCLPGPSRRSAPACDCQARGHACRHVQWEPTCATVRTRKKLVKREVTKEVPSFKWVVEKTCNQCGHCLGASPETQGQGILSIHAPAPDAFALPSGS
ncbi:MAG: hypothetical protein WD278_11920 [Pirellulales bacterium]